MLPLKNRLTKKRDFDKVFAGAKSAKSGFLVAKVLPVAGKGGRFGFVVSKKVSPKATARNLVKRRLRRAVEDALKNMAVGADIVFIALPGIQKQEFSQINESVALIFKKI